MTIPTGRAFYKMSGSGNDFVVVNAISEPAGELADAATIRAICADHTGVGADGIVFLEPSPAAAFRMRYLNRDGSPAAMCGNAALCVTRLAVELGLAEASGMRFETDSGAIDARVRDGLPEVDLAPVAEVRESIGLPRGAGEQRMGFALVGVPHVVVLCDDVASVDVLSRGRLLRRDPSLADGANVNFISSEGDGPRRRIRTYERGVEGETLACGSGSIASAILSAVWSGQSAAVELVTASGRTLTVQLARAGSAWLPTLRGEGRIVYRGELSELI